MSKTESERPFGWATSSIQELTIKVGSGATPRGGSDSYQTSGIPLIRSMNVRFNGFDETGLAFLSGEQARLLDGVIVEAGDVLLNITGASIGRVCLAPERMSGARVNQHVCIIRLREGVQPAFLAGFLASPIQQQLIMAEESGATRQALTKDKILKFTIPLPPLNEQRRIVAKLEELFSELDAGVEALRRAQRRLARYRQALLQAAVTGELTREWRETQAHDIKLGKVDSQAGWPPGWQICKVADLLSEPLCNGLSIKEATSPTEVRALKLNAMGESGFNYAEHRYLPIAWSEVEDLAIKPSDLFVSRGNGSLRLVGRSVLAQAPPFPVIFPDTMIRLRLKGSLGRWVNSIWPSRQIRNQIESSVKTTAGIWKINQGELENIEVPLPSASERAVILTELDRRLSAADAVDATLQANLRRAERLRQAILERAFRGELVPQDPNDEPPHDLLSRINQSNGSPSGQSVSTKRSYIRKSKPTAGGAR